ncbi:NSFL1 cofactor p47 [Tyrophagus putrescentiae]|nr:NSFL1 cofactor p47 [Tyrophagus putrescentiae]
MDAASAGEDRAQFFLDLSGWNVELAIQSYYDFDSAEAPQEFNPRENLLQDLIDNVDGGDDDTAAEMADENPNPRPANEPQNKDSNNNQRQRQAAAGGIATLSSLRENPDQDQGQHRQAFYAGGSEHSGQQVLGPNGRKKNTDRIVSDMFKQAKENAEVLDPSEAGPSSRFSAFTGSGYSLGTEAIDSQQIAGPSAPGTQENTRNVLKFWSNGFSIDDGPLRAYDDPANAAFLESIRRGEIPDELSQNGRIREKDISMQDHRDSEYQPPPKKAQPAFVGEGHRLGTPASELIAQSASALPNDPKSKEKAAADAAAFINFDASQPNTKIQVRLADGSRMIIQINLSRLVSDLRQYICISRPEYAVIPFNLMTTFPNKVIEDETATIQASGLANASVVQRLV